VLTQTYEYFELVIVDDCSTDDSFSVACRYRKDPRVVLECNETNLGQFPNRKRAAELARGHYLKYVDSDDLLYRHSLAIMVEALETNPDAAVALSHSAPEDAQPYPWQLTPVEAWRKQFLGRGCLSAGPSAAILKRDDFFAVGGFGKWGVLNDIDLWYRMSARWPVLLLPPGLVWYRRHPRQELTNDRTAMVCLEKGFLLAMETLSSRQCPLSEAERLTALNRARQHHARHLLSLAIRNRQLQTAWRLFTSSGIGFCGLVRGLKPYQ